MFSSYFYYQTRRPENFLQEVGTANNTEKFSEKLCNLSLLVLFGPKVVNISYCYGT